METITNDTDSQSKPILHQSQISAYLRCGMQYYWRYVQDLIAPPSVALIRGTATHTAVDKNLEHKRDHGRLLDADAVADIARDSVNEEWERGEVLIDEDSTPKKAQGETVDGAVRLATFHHETHADSLEPVYIERPFRFGSPALAVDLQGTIDLQEPTRLRDLKTAAKTPAATVAENSLQLTMYSMAAKVLDGVAPVSLHLDTLVDLKKGPSLVIQSTTRGPEDWQSLLHRVNTMNDAIEKGVFLPTNPDNWVCSKRFCGYWNDICPFGRANRNRTETMSNE